MWMADVYTFSDEMYNKLPLTTMVCESYEDAVEKEIFKLIDYLKENEKNNNNIEVRQFNK